jgi:hypothetical protein
MERRSALPPSAAPDGLLEVLQEELARNLEGLRREDPAPYFLSYSVRDVTSLNVSAAFGAIETDDVRRRRTLTISIRVGDEKLDNTHPDGREELVRGARIEGLGVRAFKDVLAASSERYVHNTFRGDPLSGVDSDPGIQGTSVVAPWLLFDEVVVKAQRGPFPRPPAVPRPPS